MELLNSSQIFKSEIRGKIENQDYKCLSTFNYLDYYHQSRNPFKTLAVLNDETLAAQKSVNYFIESDLVVILIPLFGAIELKSNNTVEIIDLNQTKILAVNNQDSFTITNPYENELVNFLQIRINLKNIKSAVYNFDLSTKNTLNSVFSNEEIGIAIGVFGARTDTNYTLKNGNVFTFILNGAFEFQNRLLENRDGLSIQNIQEIEFEALSENAMLLLIDL